MTEPRSEQDALGPPNASTMTPTTLTLLVGRIVAALLAWSGTVIIVRSLSTRDWGAYSFVFSVLGIIGLLTDLQVSRVVIRELMADADGAGPVLGSFCLFAWPSASSATPSQSGWSRRRTIPPMSS